MPIIKKGYTTRKSRGYSLQEISLSPKVTRKNSTSVAMLRQTKYSENVEQLKSIQKAFERKQREKPASKQ